MINRIKKVFLVGLGAFSLNKRKVKKLYKVGKKAEEKGEYIIDQLLAGIGEEKKVVKKRVRRAIKKVRPLARKVVKRAKPLARKVLKKVKARKKKAARRGRKR